MASVARTKGIGHFLLQLRPLKRLLISVIFAVACLFITRLFLSAQVSGIIMWCGFSFSYLVLSWVVLFNRSIEEIRRVAKVEDGSNIFVFVLILVSSFASLVTVLILITSGHAIKQDGYVAVACALSILLSWMLVHTTYTFHYAHLYYDDDPADSQQQAEGLLFPHTKIPDYLDFAYFAFVVGMTFQVSDVQITSRHIRRLALVHGLIAFVLNTFVVALTINLIAGLRS